MTVWTSEATGLGALDAAACRQIETLVPVELARGTPVFHPGDTVKGFVVVLKGRIEVFLTGPSGRDILLYAVEPGGSCVQTTLGLLGGDDYSGEAVAAADCRLVLIPRGLFLTLMDSSATFRAYVFSAFAARMQGMMHVLERVAFQRVESRLAQALLDRATDGVVHATHQELATAIGSAREVVSRRLDALQRSGWVATERGAVRLTDAPALRRLAAAAE
ncbi:Crp/Fnr family transcriptional regulator [Defluviimonas salinarum]|uniref:Crp/Fnr family transcriptional regulator n=1 Tax=Defluviimonas salinarum TaxID=2992147 RepID=A0ABT3IZD4_9RHOB|nr:Crp/Fnr family transcriptional regulator [Defluviimonas salinarum]MCW3780798.1 Crp/Fnr family transcriptional regulator [Defluviimonas salinarum]